MSVRQKVRRDGSVAWQYDFMHDGIRYRGLGGATKTQALRVQEKIRNQVLNGEHDLIEHRKNPRIDDFVVTFLDRRRHLKSKKRDNLSARTLLKFFSGKTLREIAPGDIEDYVLHRKAQNIANATINRELACLKRMYNLAMRWGDAKKNPVSEIDFLKEPPGRSRYLSKEEMARLLNSCNEHLRPLVFTALYTGMRLSELLTLKWSQVFIDNVLDPYIELVETKNGKSRLVPISDDLVTVLESVRGHHTEYVFIGERGNPLKSVKKPFETALRKAAITEFRFHDLRHTFASHFIMNGGDVLALKEILGHSSLKMVERYAHLAQAHKRRQVNNLKGVFSDCHLFVTRDTLPERAKIGSL